MDITAKEQNDSDNQKTTTIKKPQIKAESKPTSIQHTSIIHATFQKMFNLEGISDKPKSSKSPRASSASGSADERSQIDNGTKISGSRAVRISSTNSTASSVPRPRFEKCVDGTHVHNLQQKRPYRMQNILKELSLHVNPQVEERPPCNRVPLESERPPFRQCNSEASLTEKYGKCQEVIGKGAFGIVRIAHKIEPKIPGEKLFAVKEFKKRNNEPIKKYIKRLTSEFCISSSLKHVNVIETLDLLQDTQGSYCEVMEYCAGGDLYTLIVASGGLEQDEADCFFGQLINGVKYIHDNGVAHRDLKPENLLLTSSGCLKITDFGNSECFRMAWETQAHLSRGICGSEPYIAPEEFIQDWFDPRLVDIWACGIIYIGMLTGRQLWRIAKAHEDCNFKTYLQARMNGKILSPFQELSNSRRRIINKIIEPNPKQRITAEQIMSDSSFVQINICCKSPHNSATAATSNATCSANAVVQRATAVNNTALANMV